MKNNTAEQTTILEDLASYWADRAHSYSAQNLAEMNDWRKLILKHAPEKECLRILDVGQLIWRWQVMKSRQSM